MFLFIFLFCLLFHCLRGPIKENFLPRLASLAFFLLTSIAFFRLALDIKSFHRDIKHLFEKSVDFSNLAICLPFFLHFHSLRGPIKENFLPRLASLACQLTLFYLFSLCFLFFFLNSAICFTFFYILSEKKVFAKPFNLKPQKKSFK